MNNMKIHELNRVRLELDKGITGAETQSSEPFLFKTAGYGRNVGV